MDDIFVPTMTLNEATQLFRSCGVAMSETVLADGLEQGRFPFGVCIQGKKGRTVKIFTKQITEYLKERSIRGGKAT